MANGAIRTSSSLGSSSRARRVALNRSTVGEPERRGDDAADEERPILPNVEEESRASANQRPQHWNDKQRLRHPVCEQEHAKREDSHRARCDAEYRQLDRRMPEGESD